MPSGNNSGGWLADLFGGQDKTYSDKDGNDIRMSQSANDRAVNASRGGSNDYPHNTHNNNGDGSWHYSPSKSGDREANDSIPTTSSSSSSSPKPTSADADAGSFDLFNPSTW